MTKKCLESVSQLPEPGRLGIRARRPALRILCVSLCLVLLLSGVEASAAAQDENIPPGTREDIIMVAADATKDVSSMKDDSTFIVRNYTDKAIKTCFYYPNDNVMVIPIAIKDDKDDCITTPAAGKKKYRTDTVEWREFRRKPGYYHTLERELNARVFRKTRLGTYKRYCTRKGIFQPDQLRIREDGDGCSVTVVRNTDTTYLKSQGISGGKHIYRWTEAHKERINYLVARNDRYVIVAIRGTSNYQNLRMNGELSDDDPEKKPRSKADKRRSIANAVPIPKRGASVHTGWWRASGKIYDQVEPVVSDWAGKRGSKKELIVTGHSMGGAVATYLATRFMEAGYGNVHLVTFGSPRVSTRSFVRKFNALADSNAASVSFVERPDDPRILDWVGPIEKLPGITIYGVDRYVGKHVVYRSGCSDPHSGSDYHGRAKSSAYVCDEDGDGDGDEEGRRRRIGRPSGAGDPDTSGRGDRRER